MSQDKTMGDVCFLSSLAVLVFLLEVAHSLMNMLPEP